MLNHIIKFSLKNKLFVLLGAVVLIVGGVYTSQKMDVDVFPDLTAPTVVIMTDAHGMATEEVERLVTFPIETAVNGATNVRRVRSASMQGYSFVWTEFEWGMDIYKARQVVSEKLATIAEKIPSDIVPVMAPQSSVMGEILFVGLQADTTSMMKLRTLADWIVKPAILATGGVSQVTIIGGDLKQFQILADPIKMNHYGISIFDLENIGKTFSDNSEGGVVREYGNEYVVRGIARTTNLEELGQTLIKKHNGYPVVLSDVAEVKIGSAVKYGYGYKNGKPAIIMSVSKQPNINTLDVTEKIEQNLESIRKSLPSDVKMDTHIFRQADFIDASVNNVGSSLIEGAIFVIIILFLFLGSFRTTVISILAIPLSLLGTVIVLDLLGMNINTMTLGGMCIAIGSLVDDAIIDVENVYKRLRQNHKLPKNERRSSFDVVFEGSKEIRASIINATLIIIVSFIPLFFLGGMEGRMLKPLGIAYIISLFMSLIVAMTITPLLCKIFFSDEKYLDKNEKDSWISRKLSFWYKHTLDWALRNKKMILIPVLTLFVIAVITFFNMGSSFLPKFNEGSLTIRVVAKPGISLDESNKLGLLTENLLMSIPEVTGTTRRTGRGELDEHSQSTNSAELDVNYELKERAADKFLHEVREKLGKIPGVVTTVGQPLGHRIDHMISGTRASIAMKLFGTDLSEMFIYANKIKNSISGIPGLVDLAVEQQVEVPQLQIRANRNMLSKYGISMKEFNKFIELAFSGSKIADMYEGQRSFDIVVRLNKDYTQNIESLKSALISTDSGKKIALSEVADFVSAGGPNKISRENVQRKIVVSANVAGRDLNSVVKDIQKKVDSNIKLPAGYRLEYGGQFKSSQEANRILSITSIMAIFIILLLLYGEFKNLSLSAIILLNLPLALIGGIFAVWLDSAVISIPAIIGFITLFGIATRNGILLISKYQHLLEAGESRKDLILHGSIDRLNPIIMTALTSGLALIPMIFNGDKSGNEIQSPMAVVVLGGLITSTLLNIYVVPLVYDWFINRKLK